MEMISLNKLKEVMDKYEVDPIKRKDFLESLGVKEDKYVDLVVRVKVGDIAYRWLADSWQVMFEGPNHCPSLQDGSFQSNSWTSHKCYDPNDVTVLEVRHV